MTSRRQKIIQACENLFDLMKEHHEWNDSRYEWDKNIVKVSRDGEEISFLMSVRFDQYGDEIFKPRCETDDIDEDDWGYDEPVLDGFNILNEMAKKAANIAGLKMDSTLKPIFGDAEKGWIDAGFATYSKPIKRQ